MLAKPLPTPFKPRPGEYAAEEKYDGHRLLVRVAESQGTNEKLLTSWSRTGKDSARKLSPLLAAMLRRLPCGLYDGELVSPGGKHYAVSALENHGELVYRVFDILEGPRQQPLTQCPYSYRRQVLVDIFAAAVNLIDQKKVSLAESWPVLSYEDLMERAHNVWKKSGEGLIIKRLTTPYFPGKRSDAFYKVKLWQSAVLTVIGFEAGKGEKNYRGEYAITLLRDDDGNTTAVKTLDDATCRKLESLRIVGVHPYVGRRLMIEYTSRTPDMSYENPKWDRWEDE